MQPVADSASRRKTTEDFERYVAMWNASLQV